MTKTSYVKMVVLGLCLALLAACSGGLAGLQKAASTPKFDPSLCPAVVLEKFLAASGADVKAAIKTQMTDGPSVNAYTGANSGGVMFTASMYIYDHKLTSAELMQVDASQKLDAAKLGDGSIAFMRGPLMNIGGNVTEVQFYRGKVLMTVIGQDLVNAQDIPLSEVLPLAQAVDQAMPAGGLPYQPDCVTK